METEALIGLAGAPVVLALVAAVRQAVNLPTRFLPLLAVALGVAWNLGLKGADVPDINWGTAAILGVLSGLSASGLYSGTKATAGS
jgi:predicted RND superfamily exporter protein